MCIRDSIVARATSSPASHTTAPPVYAAGTTDQLGPDLQGLDLVDLNLEESDDREQDLGGQDQDLQETLYSPPRQGDSIRYPGGVQNLAPADQSSGVIRFRQDRPRQTETKPPAPSRTMPQFSDVSAVQLHDREPGLDPAVASIPVNVLLQLSVTECPAPTPCSGQLPVATRKATPQWRRGRRPNFGCPNL